MRRTGEHRDIGATVLVPLPGLVAEAHQKLGRPGDGLSAVTEGLTVAQTVRTATIGRRSCIA